MNRLYDVSPCLRCSRVSDPDSCENKHCVPWRNWFVAQWNILHDYPRRMKDRPGEKLGVAIGGHRYAPPSLLQSYLKNDPCNYCACTWDQCHTPCRARQNWTMVKREVACGLEA